MSIITWPDGTREYGPDGLEEWAVDIGNLDLRARLATYVAEGLEAVDDKGRVWGAFYNDPDLVASGESGGLLCISAQQFEDLGGGGPESAEQVAFDFYAGQ